MMLILEVKDCALSMQEQRDDDIVFWAADQISLRYIEPK